MPQVECDHALEYYTEYFLDAGVDDTTDVIPMVGTPEEVAVRIWDECVDKQVMVQKESGGVKNTAKTLWLIILGIFAAPVAVPIAITVAILIFTLIFVFFVVLAAIAFSGIAIVVAGVMSIPGIFWAQGIGQVFVLIGMTLVSIALGVIIFGAVYELGEWVITKLAAAWQNRRRRKEGRAE